MQTGAKQRDSSLVQVLSLYLLMLCFFILLFQMSRVEELKATKVAGSLNAAFAANGRPTDDARAFTSMEGSVLVDAAFEKRIGDLVRAALPLARVDVISAGEVYEIRSPLADIFLAESALLDPSAEPFVGRLAVALASRERGFGFTLKALVSGDWITPDQLARAEPLAIARAGRLASSLLAAGAPVGLVSAGVEQGDLDELRLVFRTDYSGGRTTDTLSGAGAPR